MITRTALAFAALFALPAAASAQTCDATAWTNDPTGFADLQVDDFQDMAASWDYYAPENPLQRGGVTYTGVWVSDGWGIPGMDGTLDDGSTNHFLASPVDLSITFDGPTDRIGFRYGTQAGQLDAIVTLSDGTQHHFVLDDDVPGGVDYGWGVPASGFFGYCTSGTGVTIESVYLYGGDGGIDDVQVQPGTVVEPPPADTGTCDDPLALETAILDLGLDAGIENALLSKLDAAWVAIDDGRTETAIHPLEAMSHQISALAGKKMTEEEAADLLACLDELLTALRG